MQQIFKSRITLQVFEHLHEQVDKTRSSTIEIKVLRTSLNSLIADNTEMYFILSKDHSTGDRWTKRLENSDGVPNAAHEALIGTTRKNSKLVAIDKKIVLYLLIDHSIMVGILSKEN